MVAIAGNITESLGITDWRVSAHKCKDGSLSGTSVATGTTYSVTCADADPCNVTIAPKVDYVWSAARAVAVGDCVIPSNPEATPHLWKATEVGGPYYSNVSLLLHCDGTNGSTTFTDSSPSPKTVTANGNAQISTTQSKFGGAAGAFDGTGDYLFADHADFAFGAGNFTIETWIYLNANTDGGFGTLAHATDAAGLRGVNFWIVGGSGAFRVRLGRSEVGLLVDILGSGSLSTGQWYHIAVTRESTGSNGVKLWVDGTLNAQGTCDYDLTHTKFVAGRSHATVDAEYLNGYLDDVRVTKGVARYTSNFTPPAGPFTDNKTGGTEPTWNLSGNTTDNGVTWTYVAPLVDPVTLGPRVPA